MTAMTLLLIAVVAIYALLAYACCVLAGRCDRQIELGGPEMASADGRAVHGVSRVITAAQFR